MDNEHSLEELVFNWLMQTENDAVEAGLTTQQAWRAISEATNRWQTAYDEEEEL